MTRSASGIGLATLAGSRILEVWYPVPVLGDSPPLPGGLTAGVDEGRGTVTRVVTTTADLDQPPADTADAYLRLHLLSHRLVTPGSINLEGIFTVLQTVVWTDRGPCAAEDFETTRARLRPQGPVTVLAVDKFPRMVDYVVPSGIRIGDGDRVRLGAHLAPGTVVMHEGFVNFNAGTLGVSMVEGRISQGVVVGDGSDIGGGASVMGTLSGGGTERIRIGRRCLIGANAGIGISLGDGCVVEAGLYVTAGSKVTVRQVPGHDDGAVIAARELSGAPGILYRRHSVTGAVEAAGRGGNGVVLNEELHARG